MIPAPDTLTQVDELPGEEIEFGIGDHRWVMKTQADLYSDIATAIIREYSTNAYDAHVMAGNSDPIKVTLPSVMNPFFVVEDKGVGMNLDLFRRVYTQFGVSDKRESNDTNGMLGYGSKSGVAYTTSFSVTSVRDGMKIHGVIQRKPDWRIVLKVVSTVKTDEPNGTTITIPVHDVQEFTHKANEFYKFWLPGRVLVNGKEPVHHVGKKITEGLYYSQDWNTSYVVMGNVPYRIANPAALFRDTNMNYLNFVAYVDSFATADGSAPVEFTPSREDLKYTERTKDTLSEIVKKFEKDIVDKAKADIAKATTHPEAFLAWHEWTQTLGKNMFGDLEFKGDKFQSDFQIPAYRYQPNASYNATHRINNWGVEAMPRTMVVTGFDINVSSETKKKAKAYAKHMDWNANYILFTAKQPSEIDSKWITKDQFVDWETLKAALPKQPKQPRTYSGTNNPNYGRVPGSWDFYTDNGYETEKPIPTTVKAVYYITLQHDKSYQTRSVLTALGEKNVAVLVVPANRLKKLLRDFPSVTNFMDHAKSKVVADSPSLLTADAVTMLGISRSTRQWLKALDPKKCNDPEIGRLRSLVHNEDALMDAYLNNLALARMTGQWYTTKQHDVSEKNDYIAKHYPLLSYMTTRIVPHTYLYMNAAHAAETENNNV